MNVPLSWHSINFFFLTSFLFWRLLQVSPGTQRPRRTFQGLLKHDLLQDWCFSSCRTNQGRI